MKLARIYLDEMWDDSIEEIKDYCVSAFEAVKEIYHEASDKDMGLIISIE